MANASLVFSSACPATGCAQCEGVGADANADAEPKVKDEEPRELDGNGLSQPGILSRDDDGEGFVAERGASCSESDMSDMASNGQVAEKIHQRGTSKPGN